MLSGRKIPGYKFLHCHSFEVRAKHFVGLYLCFLICEIELPVFQGFHAWKASVQHLRKNLKIYIFLILPFDQIKQQ